MHEINVTGTDIRNYYICKRETWLNLHKIAPDQEDNNIQIGKYSHQLRNSTNNQEIPIGSITIDSLHERDGELIVQEYKKSASCREGSQYQLLYYLDTLRQMGVIAKGELIFEEEQEIQVVEWNHQQKIKLDQVIVEIQQLALRPTPPQPSRTPICGGCGYREYCWAEG